MSVEFQQTPNPDAGKFVVDGPLVEGDGSRSVMSPEEAADDPLSRAILDVEGVRTLFYAEDFVTVTKAAEASWERIIPRVSAALREHLE